MAMLRGRMGGAGDAFNLGEMTIARCSIRDAAGRIGHGYAAGRDLAKVELIARLDAALQEEALRPLYAAAVLDPLAVAQDAARAATEARAVATEVKFFTLATMPAPLSVAAASVLLTLADAATAVSVEAPARDWLLFHTGARLAGDAVADFVATRARPKLHSLRAGTDDEPEAGATLILDVEAFDGPVYRLTGPGMAEAATVRLPLEQKFLEEWRACRAALRSRRRKWLMSRSKAASRRSKRPMNGWRRTGAATRRWTPSRARRLNSSWGARWTG